MKLLIASDIHGSALWCEKLLDVEREFKPDGIILLGDILYHGPRNPLPEGHNPKEVARMLNEHANKIKAVRGNCEAEVDQMMLSFPCMSDYTVIYDGSHELWCTHGHLFNPEKLPPLKKGTFFLLGHTHVQQMVLNDEILIINPGSISLPKDGKHGYALYEDGHFTLKNLA